MDCFTPSCPGGPASGLVCGRQKFLFTDRTRNCVLVALCVLLRSHEHWYPSLSRLNLALIIPAAH
jgi:hypothetical protein